MKVLVPIKNRTLAAAQVAAALPYCRISPTSSLLLLTVIEPVHISSPRYTFDEVAQAVETDALIRAQAYLDRTRDSLAAMVPAERIETKVILGRPFDEIANVAKSASVDLVIAAQTKKQPLLRLLCGSFTARLSKRLACPVIVLRDWISAAEEGKPGSVGAVPQQQVLQFPGAELISRAWQRLRAGA